MPWVAQNDRGKVIPEEASKRDDLCCPECGEPMSVIDSFIRESGSFVSSHFRHKSDPTPDGGTTTGCGGESDEHKRMKCIVNSKIRHIFDTPIETVDIEHQIGSKQADVGVVFVDGVDHESPIEQSELINGVVGDKIAVEVQYKNDTKDIIQTERIYAEHGYSTVWVFPEQFTNRNVKLFSGSGLNWKPIYPTITRDDIRLSTNRPLFTHPNDTFDKTVDASFPPAWFNGEIASHLIQECGKSSDQLVTLFPDIAEEFANRAESILMGDIESVKSIFTAVFPLADPDNPERDSDTPPEPDRVCGNCYHSQPDSYSSDDDDVVCWKNQPGGSDNRPRKLTLDDDFAKDCSQFSYRRYKDEDVVDNIPLQDHALSYKWIKKVVAPSNYSRRDRRKESLRYAFHRTFGQATDRTWSFTPGREEAVLRIIDAQISQPHDLGCATRGDVRLPTDECVECGIQRIDTGSVTELEPLNTDRTMWTCDECDATLDGLSAFL